jgi:hypothetical protein
MADDRRVGEQAPDVALAEPRHLVGIEPGEGGPERLAFAENRQPREAGLEPLEAEPLVDAALGRDGPAPLLVVVREELRVARLPAADDYSATSTRTIPSSTVTG